MPHRRASRRAPRRRSKRPSPVLRPLLRLGGGVVALAVLVQLIPPVRSAFAAARDTLTEAMTASRRAELRRVAVARYALQYGIPLEMAADVERAAVAAGIDPDLAFRLVRVESEFHETAVSSAGALGLTQLMPATAESLQPGITREEIFERDTNLRLGFAYLRWLLEVYDGSVPEALHAYNRGPGTVDRIRAAGGDPANGYAEKVLSRGPLPYSGSGLLE